MDYKTSSLVGMGFLLIVLAFSVLGLAADSMAYVNAHQHDDLQIHYTRFNETAGAQYTYWLKMDYAPSRLTLSRESAMVANGVICAVAGAAVITVATLMRKTKSTGAGLFSPWLISLVSSVTALITSVAVAVYASLPVMKWDINFLKSLPFPTSISGAATNKAAVYQAPFPFTPEVWNCNLAPFVADSSTSGRLQSLCLEAKAAKNLTIVVVVFAGLMTVATAWAWWSARKAASAEPEVQTKEVDEISLESKA